MTVYTPRRAARVLLVNADDRVLLFAGFDPARPEHRYWFTPGGGLDPGEPPAAGAARELAEETGLRLTPAELGEPVWQDKIEYPFGGVWYRQEQQFFLVRVPSWEVDTAGFDDVEQASVTGHRWWSVAELAASDELHYPVDLVAVLSRVLATPDGPASAVAEGAVPTGGPVDGAPC
ncbi:NUDIX domain-containing protein [Micromonospora sp. NPDC023737]|uniref:NUDIX hydrolase n=1 Tax=unclassified Micromonospora TaxID=2617518 RepID=UPI0033DFBCB2